MSKSTERYKETFNTWNKVAKMYEDKFMNLDLYNDTYDIFCQLIKKDEPTVLEIGCGPGNITKYILCKRPDFKILGIDIAANMIELAKENNPIVNFKIMDCRNIENLKTKFDAIICGFCLPYLSKNDRTKLIIDCKNLLSKNGIIYISFIDGNYEKSGFQTGTNGDRVYFYYHELEYLKSELIENEFQILNTKNIESHKQNEIEIHTILIARNNKRTHNAFT